MEKIKFNYAKLKGRITEKVGTQKVLAEKLGIMEGTLSGKLAGNTYFTQDEILKTISILEIDPAFVSQYFFTV